MRHNVNDFHYFLMLNRILTSSIPYTYIQFSTFYNSHCHCTCTMTLHLWLANQHFNLCHPKFLIHIYLCFYKMEQHFQFKAQNYLILLFWCRGPLQTQIPPDFQRVDDQEFAFSYNTTRTNWLDDDSLRFFPSIFNFVLNLCPEIYFPEVWKKFKC